MGHPVVHFEIGSRNTAKAGEFYQALFGWGITPQGPATMIDTASPAGIQGNLATPEGGQGPYVTFYVAVPDLAATLAQAEKLGGKTLVPPTDIPGMGAFAWFSDLDGNALGLWKAAG